MNIYQDYIIRNFKESDYLQVSNLWLSLGLGNTERGDNLDIINKTLEIGGKLILILDKNTDEIIGTSWITHDGRRSYLHHFGIAIPYQGKGLSKILLKHTLIAASQIGLQIKLEVNPKNLKAVNLYSKAGFKLLGDYEVHIIRDVTLLK